MSAISHQIETELEKAECASTAEEARDHFRKVIEILEAKGLDRLDSRMAYAFGYAWYNLPDETPNRVALAEKCFRDSIAKSADNFYAALYLGHLFFDLGRHEEALREFIKIPENFFTKHNQAWRDLKLIELIFCCYLYIRRSKEAVQTLSRLINESSKIDDIDRPKMTELGKALGNILMGESQQG